MHAAIQSPRVWNNFLKHELVITDRTDHRRRRAAALCNFAEHVLGCFTIVFNNLRFNNLHCMCHVRVLLSFQQSTFQQITKQAVIVLFAKKEKHVMCSLQVNI